MSNSLFRNMVEYSPGPAVEDSSVEYAKLRLEGVELLCSLETAEATYLRVSALSGAVESFDGDISEVTQSVINFALEDLRVSLEALPSTNVYSEEIKSASKKEGLGSKIAEVAKKAWKKLKELLKKAVTWIRKQLAIISDNFAVFGVALRRTMNSIKKIPDETIIKVTTWDPIKKEDLYNFDSGESTRPGKTTIGASTYLYDNATGTLKVENSGQTRKESELSALEMKMVLTQLNLLSLNRSKLELVSKLYPDYSANLNKIDNPTEEQKKKAKESLKLAKLAGKFDIVMLRAEQKYMREVYKDCNNAAKKYLKK